MEFTGKSDSIDELARRRLQKTNVYKLISLFGMYGNFSIYQNKNMFLLTMKNKSLLKKLCSQKHPFFCLNVKNCIKIIKDDVNKNIYEELINFDKHRKKFSSQIGRYEQSKYINFFGLYLRCIISSQKFIRGFLARRNLNDMINLAIIKQSIKYILLIQKVFRGALIRKIIRKNIIILRICEDRYKKVKMLQKYMKHFYQNIREKKIYLYNLILSTRLPKIKMIQKNYKAHYYAKISREIIAYEKLNYAFEYPFHAKNVQLKLYAKYTFYYTQDEDSSHSEIIDFEFCVLRKIFVLHIPINKINPGRYRCQFIVDGFITCDGRFPLIENEEGELFNLIDFRGCVNDTYNKDNYNNIRYNFSKNTLHLNGF